MANAILNFHFDYWNPSLTNNQRAEDPAWRNRGGTCQPWGIIGSFDIELTFTGGRLCRSIFRPGRCKTTSELNICVPGLKKGKTEEKLFLFWQAVVSTMCQPQYESSVADADILISAKVIKVTKHLYLYLAVWCTNCSPGQVQVGRRCSRDSLSWRGAEEAMHGHQRSGEETHCKDDFLTLCRFDSFSLKAFQTALELATDEARER